MPFSGYAATLAAVIVWFAVRLPATFAPIEVMAAALAAAAGVGFAAGFAVPFLWHHSCAAITAAPRPSADLAEQPAPVLKSSDSSGGLRQAAPKACTTPAVADQVISSRQSPAFSALVERYEEPCPAEPLDPAAILALAAVEPVA